MLSMRVEDIRNPRVGLPFLPSKDSIGRQFGEQGRMADCNKSKRYVQRLPDLMCDIEGLHPLVAE